MYSFLFSCRYIMLFYGWVTPARPVPPHERGFTITLDRTPLDEQSARRWEIYLTIHSSHKRQTSTILTGFEPAIPINLTLDHAVTWIGKLYAYVHYSATVLFQTVWWWCEIFSVSQNAPLNVRKSTKLHYSRVSFYDGFTFSNIWL